MESRDGWQCQDQSQLLTRSVGASRSRLTEEVCAGSHIDELKDSKANAGSAVNRSPDLTGDTATLGSPVLGSTTGMGASKTSTAPTTGMGSSKTSTAPMSGSTLTGTALCQDIAQS